MTPEPEALNVVNTIFQGVVSLVVTGVGLKAIKEFVAWGRWAERLEGGFREVKSDLGEIKDNLKDSNKELWTKLGIVEEQLRDARERLAAVEQTKVEVRP